MPDGEERRLASLHALGLLDTAPDEHFDRITRLAQTLFQVPIALVTLVDENRQWFKSHPGLSLSETAREIAFCAHTIASDEILVVADAHDDPRFAENTLVTGEPFIRFYAGCPLQAADGSRIGSLAIIDSRPRKMSAHEQQLLRDLAGVVESEINSLQVTTFDRLPVGIYRSTAEGRILDANPALVSLLGYPDRESLLATSAWDIYPDRQDRSRLLAGAHREGAIRGVETQMRRKDGSLLWVRLNTFFSSDRSGRPLFMVGSIEDVTERRLAEEALWDSEARQKLLLEQLPAVLWATDAELRFTQSQGAGLALLNLRPNQLAGMSLFEYFGTDAPDFPPIAAHRRALGGEAVSYQTEWAGRTFESHVRPFVGSDGEVAGVLGIALDVTEQKRLQESANDRAATLARRERQMSAVLESALDAVIGMDAEGRITRWNSRAERMFGWKSEEVVGEDAAERIMPARFRADHRRGLRHFNVTGEGPILGRRVEMVGLRRDGTEFPLWLSVSVLRDEGKHSFNAFISDVGERRRFGGPARGGEPG